MHVLFYSTHNEPVIIKVVNGYGVVVRTWTRNATQGANNWDFDVSTLPQVHTHCMYNRLINYQVNYLLKRIKIVRATTAGPHYPKG
jgi:hypothetical protein